MEELPYPIEIEVHFNVLFSNVEYKLFNEKDINKEYKLAWKSFWEIFINEICYPDLPFGEDKFSNSSIVNSEYLLKAIPLNPNFFLGQNIQLRSNELINSFDSFESINELINVFPKSRVNIPWLDKFGRSSNWEISKNLKLAEAYGFAHTSDSFSRLDSHVNFGKVFSFELVELGTRKGSFEGKGKALLTFWGSTLILPLAIAALSPKAIRIIDEGDEISKIEKRISRISSLCKIEGKFYFDRQRLINVLKNRMEDRGIRVCEVQSVLMALGYPPGKIDGVSGPATTAAKKAFAKRWMLPEQAIDHPVFYEMLARALTGEQPPK